MPDRNRLSLMSASFNPFSLSLSAFYFSLLHLRHLHLEFQASSLTSSLTTLLCSSHFFGQQWPPFPWYVRIPSFLQGVHEYCFLMQAYLDLSYLLFPSEYSLHFSHFFLVLVHITSCIAVTYEVEKHCNRRKDPMEELTYQTMVHLSIYWATVQVLKLILSKYLWR